MGGAAIAYRCGHRTTRDLDLCLKETSSPVQTTTAITTALGVADLQWRRREHAGHECLTARATRHTPQIDLHPAGWWTFSAPVLTAANGIEIASLDDLAAMKCKTLAERERIQDPFDLEALLDAGADMAGAAEALRRNGVVSTIPIALERIENRQLWPGWTHRDTVAKSLRRAQAGTERTAASERASGHPDRVSSESSHEHEEYEE